MRIILVLILISFVPVTAQACTCRSLTEEKSRQIITDAFFIGKVRVTAMAPVEKNIWTIWRTEMDIIQTYKGNLQEHISATNQPTICGGQKQTGKEYEVVISEDAEHHLHINRWCDNPLPEHWDELHNTAKERQEYKIEQED